MSSDEIQKTLGTRLGNAVTAIEEFRGELSVSVETESLREACKICRDDLGFDQLLDIAGVDHLGSEPRYAVAYELYSFAHRAYLRLKTFATGDDTPSVPSVCDLWPGANWHERETWDMLGIRFSGHPDLTRILMWEGYPFHPLRKDFPLEGKSSDVPDVAFTEPAPLAGGPFVTAPSGGTNEDREPRARRAGDLPEAGLHP